MQLLSSGLLPSISVARSGRYLELEAEVEIHTRLSVKILLYAPWLLFLSCKPPGSRPVVAPPPLFHLAVLPASAPFSRGGRTAYAAFVPPNPVRFLQVPQIQWDAWLLARSWYSSSSEHFPEAILLSQPVDSYEYVSLPVHLFSIFPLPFPVALVHLGGRTGFLLFFHSASSIFNRTRLPFKA